MVDWRSSEGQRRGAGGVNNNQQNPAAQKKPPPRLYRYRKLDEATISTIVNSVIYFSKGDQFNDPFDCRLRYNHEGTDEEWRELLKRMLQRNFPEFSQEQVTNLVEKKIREGAHRDLRFLDQIDDDAQRERINKTGILCLTASPTNILMWSHYADSHKGCCLEFSTGTRIFEHAQDIKYFPEYPNLRYIDYYGDSSVHAELKWFTKSELWQYEDEWRVINPNGPGLCKFDEKSLTGIVFGYWMTAENKALLTKLVQERSPRVKLYQAVPKNRQFEMELLPL